ncbi:AIPR family protein [Nocardiopsis sp. NPDC006198]|uniref:AIPR family protein n=1 Tax=Nocardiopsis sp. NPDC006198 TaxID=3154472 RepID=UPI0033B35A67
MSDQQIVDFVEELHRRVQDMVVSEPGLMTRDAFVRHVGGYLVDDGTLDDVEPCYIRRPWQNRHVEVAGYDVTADNTILHLVTSEFGAFGSTVKRDRVDQLVRRAVAFAEFCRDGMHGLLERTSPAYDMAEHIHSTWGQFRTIRIFVLTDGSINVKRSSGFTVAGLAASVDVWDATRLHRLVSSGARQEEIRIDLEERGHTVPCLESPPQADGYRCLLAVLPGTLLAQLYEEHHSRLLQRNVRAFLQARGKVNKGIAETIRDQPGRFLAYNNGVSAVARAARLEHDESGALVLAGLTELQIVNGGQTTASLHHAWRRDIDLTDVHVPAKITIIASDELDRMVPDISRFANSQNAVTAADFEGNSRFHVRLEELSRSVWAPAAQGETRQTRWYYERVRGQYDVDRAKALPGTRRRRFDEDNPRNQRINKTDASKYELTYALRPDLVSQGGEKCFRNWTIEEKLGDREEPTEEFFRHLVAKGILFAQTRQLIRKANYGGYLAQTTTYTLALVNQVLCGVDLNVLWRLQRLPDAFVEALPEVVDSVRSVLVDPPGSANVTEWCKKEACWDAVQNVTWVPGATVRAFGGFQNG